MGDTFSPYRGRWISDFEASLVYRVRLYLKNKSQITGVVQKSKESSGVGNLTGKGEGREASLSVNHLTREGRAS